MVALSFPIIDLFRGGSFNLSDAIETSQYFTIFAISIAFWAAQAIYSRSFYAAGNTMTPAIAGWAVTLISIPIYALLFHHIGVSRPRHSLRHRHGHQHPDPRHPPPPQPPR